MAVASGIIPAVPAPSNLKSTNQAAENSQFPNAKTLLISSKRPRSFLERTARELLAGGTDVIILSALGEAIPLCIQLESSLQRKNVVTRVQVETIFHTSRSSAHTNKTPGLRITVQKHPGFKGSRISPNFVSFAELSTGGYTPAYGITTEEHMISVNAGNEDFIVGGGGINRAFSYELDVAMQDISSYTLLHQQLFREAIQENQGKSAADVRSTMIERASSLSSHVKLAFCRPHNFEDPNDPTYSTGSVFISIFNSAFPYENPFNMGMAYVVSPKGSNYSSPNHFLEAVFKTSANLMTALCDYNGFVRRGTADKNRQYDRISVCRVCLMSGGIYKHPMVSKKEIATCIVEGLASTYRHGPAPRLNFAYDDDLFMNVWAELTGRDMPKSTKEV
ncbi:Dna/Rna-binding protein Alba 4 [Cardiosporidium cionae]|uniref:Dna/Rna-binding protein Alba 4 n=1 Tax=Cardiosporidium cionae TaxID=476202 RepID=A0ABQ7JDA3_9APIC|nr:Dna/Rna-binding protein Alba 4 [Cardiosporidium cionae]|eukprot:KAF8821975.1 Dna/Rna-binding protein Alba 4 [Cardiosporidium cionae]